MGVPERLIPISSAAPGAHCDRCGGSRELAVIAILVEETPNLPGVMLTLTLCADCLLTSAAVADASSDLMIRVLQAIRARPPGS